MQSKLKAQQAAAKKKATEEKRTVLGAVNQLDQMMPRDLNVANLTPEYMDKFMNQDGSEAFRDLLGEDFKATARRRDLAISDSDWFGETADYFSQDMWGLRGSKKMAMTQADQNSIISKMLDLDVEGNKISGLSVSGDMFASDGTRIRDNDRFEADDYGKDFEVLGLVTGFKSAAADGTGESKDILVMNAYDDDGDLDKESTEKYYATRYGDQSKSPAKLGYFIALKGEDGDMVYKEVPMHQTAIRRSLADAYQSNDITETVAEEKLNDQARARVQKMTADEQFAYEEFKNKTEEVFQDPMFEMEAEQYYGAGSGGQMNRNDMMKAFYRAYETVGMEIGRKDPEQSGARMVKMLDKDVFSNYMKTAGVEEDLRDYSKNSDEIIAKFLAQINKGVEPGSLDAKAHQAIAQKWQQMLNHK
jgi:hypothetical protein